MSVPFSIVLILYFIFLSGFVVFALFNVYHALRFGMASLVNIISLVVFLTGAIFILVMTEPTISAADWNRSLFQIGPPAVQLNAVSVSSDDGSIE